MISVVDSSSAICTVSVIYMMMVLSASTCFSAMKAALVGVSMCIMFIFKARQHCRRSEPASGRYVYMYILFHGRYPLMKMFATGKRTTQHQLGLSFDVAAFVPIFIQPVALTELNG